MKIKLINKVIIKIILISFPIFSFMVAFNNCGGAKVQNSAALLGGSLSVSSDSSYDPNGLSINISSSSMVFKTFDNQYTLSGTCNTGGAAYNYISYWFTYMGTTYPGNSQFNGYCENGRYYIILTRPVSGPTGVIYQVTAQLYTGSSPSSITNAGPKFSANIEIQ